MAGAYPGLHHLCRAGHCLYVYRLSRVGTPECESRFADTPVSVFLFCLIRGMLLPTFLYSFYSKLKLPLAMLSESQFLLETLALAVLTAIVWQV